MGVGSEAGPGELVEEGVHLVGSGGFLVMEPPVEKRDERACEGVSAGRAADGVHGFGGGHGGETGLDAASEVTFP